MLSTDHLRHDSDIARLLAAFRREPVDRVPNLEFLIDRRSVEAILGRPASPSWHLPGPDYVELAHRIGQDAIGGQVFTLDGQLYQRLPAGTLHSPADLASLRPSRVNHARAEELLAAVAPTRLGVWCHLTGLFTMTYNAMGFERFCIALLDDPAFIEDLLDRALEDTLRLLDELLDYPFAFFHIGDDMGFKTQLVCRPGIVRRIWVPRIRALVEPIHTRGIPVTFHSDGKIDPIIPDLIELGFTALNPIETPAMDIYELKARFGDRLAFIGNIDVAGPLAFGTPQEIEREVFEHVSRLAPGGGYVAATSHSVIDAIPPENFIAMLDAFHRLGVQNP
jgi:uroporphyrinogen-III decarboxylase